MNFKKITAAVLALALGSSMLLTSCWDANKGKKIEEMLEDTYGGRFTLTKSVPCRPGVYFLQSPIPTFYQYFYEWNRYEGETICVTTEGPGYQTNATYVMYRPQMQEYFTSELEKKYPGGVISSFLMGHFGAIDTEIEEIDFEDALEEWDVKYMCVLAVDDVNDHKSIERAIDDIFGDYKVRVELHVVPTDGLDDILRKVDLDAEDELHLYYNYKNAFPAHEYYLYISDPKTMNGATGWYEKK